LTLQDSTSTPTCHIILVPWYHPHLPPTLKSLIKVIERHPGKIKDLTINKLLHLSSGTLMNIHPILKGQKVFSPTQVTMGSNLTDTLVDPLQEEEEDPQMTLMTIPTEEILTADHPDNLPMCHPEDCPDCHQEDHQVEDLLECYRMMIQVCI
jgi:hypothetical protein